ncbi:MAG: hypothetical protein JO368_13135 [Acidimicrobiales bacterium]|nr:hypothetical protein [Acidimicrobiales bacterium]
MAVKRFLGVAVVALLGTAAFGSPVAATTPRPVIASLVATPATVTTLDGQSTLTASVANASSCTLSATPPALSGAGPVTCSGGSVSQAMSFPENARAKKTVTYTIMLVADGPGGAAAKKVTVRVAPGAGTALLSGVKAIVGATRNVPGTFCALLSSGGVDCWGYGRDGQLGNGTFASSATPVEVEGVGGAGTLGAVASLTAGNGSICALLTSGGVDCWGTGYEGELGDGNFYPGSPYGSATPVQVEGVSGTGILTGVASIATDDAGYCAQLASGGVDCWGRGVEGQLGDGNFYPGSPYGSATPVQVTGVNGSGILTGVASITGDSYQSFCAVLRSHQVDCWGNDESGEIGGGSTANSATPVQVEGVSGVGKLTGVRSLVTANASVCALLSSKGVDCWGNGSSGDLGNGTLSNSDTPVHVRGVGGRGTLGAVSALSPGGQSVCALLTSGGADCWGSGPDGELGNGRFADSTTPVRVEGVRGGNLSRVATLLGDSSGHCAGLTSGEADCWGFGYEGELGNGTFYNTTRPYGSPKPVQVAGTSGGVLVGVASLASYSAYSVSRCSLLASGGVDCWGYGADGELGNGTFYATNDGGSATPVPAVAP